MVRIALSRILVLIALSLMVAGIPESASAQHGGHIGGGGFHSGGGGFHGGNFGGSRGGTFAGGGFSSPYGRGGFRGHGYGGFYGRGFGFPGYGYGLGFSFGFGPYWGYPYYYGYGPGWTPYAYYDPYDSYYYPDGPADPRDDYYPRGNRDGCDYRHEDEHPCQPKNRNAPTKPSRSTVPESYPRSNDMTMNSADEWSI